VNWQSTLRSESGDPISRLFPGHAVNLGGCCEKSVKNPEKRLKFLQITVLFTIIRRLPNVKKAGNAAGR
jgi:hypothetical protein